MKNVDRKYPKVEFHKMCNKKSKEGNGDLCISITGRGSFITHNHHIDKDNFLDFVIKQYEKEFLKRWGINKKELLKLQMAKQV